MVFDKLIFYTDEIKNAILNNDTFRIKTLLKLNRLPDFYIELLVKTNNWHTLKLLIEYDHTRQLNLIKIIRLCIDSGDLTIVQYLIGNQYIFEYENIKQLLEGHFIYELDKILVYMPRRINDYFYYSVKNSDEYLIDYYKNKIEPYEGLSISIDLNNLELIKYFVELGLDITNILQDRTPNLEIILYLTSKGMTKYNLGLVTACREVNLDSVKYFIDLGANNLNRALEIIACTTDDITIAEYLISNGANDFDPMLVSAVKSGHINMAKLAIKNGATNIGGAIQKTIRTLELLDLLDKCNIFRKYPFIQNSDILKEFPILARYIKNLESAKELVEIYPEILEFLPEKLKTEFTIVKSASFK
jgi:hypothetical protein